MDIESQHQQTENIYALEEVRDLPLMLANPLYRYYPAMKLGQRQAVDFFSQKLSAVAARFLQGGHNQQWTITAPPYYHLPAAANLLARKTHELLSQRGFNITFVQLRLSQEQIVIRNQAEFKSYYDYSKNNLAQRIAERERTQQMLITDGILPHFLDHSVIIINDINVTGTQQHFMQKSLGQLHVQTCFWLYIFNVEKTLARQHPEIEHQINHSQINDLDSYANVLADGHTQHTARCISRLFNENMDDFRYLMASLDDRTRSRIHQLAYREGRYNSPFFKEKMDLLAA